MSSSNSASDKIVRAVSQVENAERLIASLPRRYYKDEHKREAIRSITAELRKMADYIRAEFKRKST